MPFTYILKCSDNTFYTGWTTDLEKRLEKHNKGTASKYTRTRLPVKLVYFEEFSTRSDCQKRECEIKTFNRKEKENIIKIKPLSSN
jgi:putative endonuclease